MPPQVIRMADEPHRFGLKWGDRVAWRLADGQHDLENSGIVVDGTWEGDPPGGSYRITYQVQRGDHQYFNAEELQLICLITEAKIREQMQEQFRTGALPRSMPSAPPGELEGYESIRINFGRGKPCSACGRLIPLIEVGSIEYEYPPSQVVRLHAACHAIWEEERHRPIRRMSSS